MVMKCVWNESHNVRQKDGYCPECSSYSGWETDPPAYLDGKKPKDYPPSDQLLDDLTDIILEESAIDPPPYTRDGEMPDYSVIILPKDAEMVRDKLRARIFKFVKDEFAAKRV